MPLIEELELEVETLDGIDGLRASASQPRSVAEVAPAIRLACTAALTSTPQGQAPLLNGVTFMQEEPSAVVRVGAAVALIGALIWGAVSFRPLWHGAPVKLPETAARYSGAAGAAEGRNGNARTRRGACSGAEERFDAGADGAVGAA